jgi:hypothetical protein
LAIKALSHTYVVDQIFAAHLRRRNQAYTSANLSLMPRLEDLSTDIRNSDREYLDYVSTLNRDQLSERIDLRLLTALRAECPARKCLCM